MKKTLCGVECPVIYDDPSFAQLPLVSLPERTDSLEQMADKMRELVAVFHAHHSLAVRSGYRGTPNPNRDPVEIAKSRMDLYELEMYTTYTSKGCRLQPYDWESCTAPVPCGKGSQLRYTRAASALREIFKDESLTPENASWFYQNKTFAIPLVKAIMKIDGARRDLVNGQTTLSELELAELQTIHHVNSIVGKKMNQARQELVEMHKKINRFIEAGENRIHQIMMMAGVQETQDEYY
ncbi:hypothetical protein K3495_g9232 [Podosphaera aphanis]|nr:hypothetical protein K3495_g9232 [Podosphaera aphanis]